MQACEQRRDISDETDRGKNRLEFVIRLAACDRRNYGCGEEDGMETQVCTAGPRAVQNEIFGDADDERESQERENPAMLPVVMPLQIDLALLGEFRENQAGLHINQDRLQQDHAELDERPIGPAAHTEHCPPHLRDNKEEEQGPRDDGPIDHDPFPDQKQAPPSLQNFGRGQAQNYGEKNRKVTKFIHRLRV